MQLNRNLNYVLEIIRIQFKILKEYKFNFFIGSLAHFSFMIIISLSYIILKTNFSKIIYWNLEEFIFFLIYLEAFLFLSLSAFRALNKDLISGDFNIYLTKPTNLFLTQGFKHLIVVELIFSIIYLTFLIPYFLYFGINWYNFFISIYLGISGCILLISVRIFINNLAFHIKKNNFLNEVYFKGFMNVFTSYPPSLFKETKISKLAFFVCILYYASLPTDFYFGHILLKELKIYIIILIGILLIMNFTSYFIWKTGIRKYEAFG